MITALFVAAAIITILFGIIAAKSWLATRVVVRRVTKPGHRVPPRRLSFEDVRIGLDYLVVDAKGFKPTDLYAINRGGAIVAGYVAKRLGIPLVNFLAVDIDAAQGSRVREFRTTEMIGDRVLLLDDANRKGEHMRLAWEYLRARYPNATVRRHVLLAMDLQHHGPETSAFSGGVVEKAAFHTTSTETVLPWD